MYQQKDDLFFSWYLFFVFLSFFKQIVVCISIWTGDRKSYTIHILHGCLEFYCTKF